MIQFWLGLGRRQELEGLELRRWSFKFAIAKWLSYRKFPTWIFAIRRLVWTFFKYTSLHLDSNYSQISQSIPELEPSSCSATWTAWPLSCVRGHLAGIMTFNRPKKSPQRLFCGGDRTFITCWSSRVQVCTGRWVPEFQVALLSAGHIAISLKGAHWQASGPGIPAL